MENFNVDLIARCCSCLKDVTILDVYHVKILMKQTFLNQPSQLKNIMLWPLRTVFSIVEQKIWFTYLRANNAWCSMWVRLNNNSTLGTMHIEGVLRI